MSEIIKNFLFALFFIMAAIVVLPTNASANGENGTLRHAYKPYTVEATKWMRARVDNFSTMPQKRLVCVEAFNVSTNAKTHLGCLWVDLASFNSTNRLWAAEFDSPATMLNKGTYSVVYTYQGADKMWNRIKSVSLEMQDGIYTR